jgi:hypothetical protein
MLDITTLAAWGEFIGGIAVVVSLIYLASQIRSNTKTVRASNFNELLDATDQFSSVMRDSEWASLYVRAIDDFVGLSPEDQVRFNGIISPYFNAMFRAWRLNQHDLVDDDIWENLRDTTLDLYRSRPGVKQWWDASEHWWSAEFREFFRDAAVDPEIARGRSLGTPVA